MGCKEELETTSTSAGRNMRTSSFSFSYALIQRSPVVLVLSVTYLVFNLYFPTFFFLYLDLGTASHYPQETMPEYETITQGRAKRSTAGNRMRELLEKAHQEDDDELFKEVEDDEEFVAPRKLPTPPRMLTTNPYLCLFR